MTKLRWVLVIPIVLALVLAMTPLLWVITFCEIIGGMSDNT